MTKVHRIGTMEKGKGGIRLKEEFHKKIKQTRICRKMVEHYEIFEKYWGNIFVVHSRSRITNQWFTISNKGSIRIQSTNTDTNRSRLRIHNNRSKFRINNNKAEINSNNKISNTHLPTNQQFHNNSQIILNHNKSKTKINNKYSRISNRFEWRGLLE